MDPHGASISHEIVDAVDFGDDGHLIWLKPIFSNVNKLWLVTFYLKKL